MSMGWRPELTRSVVVLLVLYALSLLDRNLIALMVAPIRAELGISTVQIGLLQGFAFAAFYVVCGIPLGMLADRVPRKWVILGGVLFWSLATMACGLARSFPELLVARFAVGVGEAALLPAAYSLLGDTAPRSQLAMAMAVFATGAMFGSGFSIVLGGVLVEHLTSLGTMSLLGLTMHPWQTTFVVVGSLGLPLALLALLLPEPRTRDAAARSLADDPDGAGFLAFLTAHWRFFALHFLGYGAIYIASAGGSGWSPVYLQQTYGWSMAWIGTAMGLGVIAFGLAGNIAAGQWIQRQLRRGVSTAPLTYFAAGSLFIGAVGGAAPWAGSGAAYILLHVSTCFFTICAAAAGTALTLVTPSPYRARIAALFTMVFNLLGTGGGPLIVGVIAQRAGGDRALGIALTANYAASGAVAALLLWAAARQMPAAIAEKGEVTRHGR